MLGLDRIRQLSTLLFGAGAAGIAGSKLLKYAVVKPKYKEDEIVPELAVNIDPVTTDDDSDSDEPDRAQEAVMPIPGEKESAESVKLEERKAA